MRIVREFTSLDKLELIDNKSIDFSNELLKTLAVALSIHVNDSFQRSISRKNNKLLEKEKVMT